MQEPVFFDQSLVFSLHLICGNGIPRKTAVIVFLVSHEDGMQLLVKLVTVNATRQCGEDD